MAVDNRVLAILLIVGIFASMTTIALYQGLVDSDVPERPSFGVQTSGFLTLEVIDEAPTVEEGGSTDGSAS